MRVRALFMYPLLLTGLGSGKEPDEEVKCLATEPCVVSMAGPQHGEEGEGGERHPATLGFAVQLPQRMGGMVVAQGVELRLLARYASRYVAVRLGAQRAQHDAPGQLHLALDKALLTGCKPFPIIVQLAKDPEGTPITQGLLHLELWAHSAAHEAAPAWELLLGAAPVLVGAVLLD